MTSLSALVLLLVQISGTLRLSAAVTSASSFATARHMGPSMGLVRKVTRAEFEEALQDCFYSSTPIVVDFFAVWCDPCQLMLPQLEKVAEHYGDRCRFLKVDADEEPEAASMLRVNGLPTILFVNDMRIIARAEGMLMEGHLKALTENQFFGGPPLEIEGIKKETDGV
eukprot:CAMPEP_0119319126 /NCGR_PEP_ID=MMETSP1333-20130426/48525_1 /TAXON_ID=418940 /ORGANISM="Scyphosphaera apsteinii, Strain RCC1455" /LENGTH=167 /DNA_ID=CAMNT_0007325465 /DNA_START=123 /DNA_END=626 /DNA_ORIENTATION=+